MGCRFNVYGMVGVPFEEVVKTETRTKQIKKFDPDTGESYMKEERTQVSLVGDKEIEDLDDFFRDNQIIECPRLGQFGIVSRGEEREQFIGILLENQDIEYGGCAGIHSLKEIAEVANEVKQKLAEIGISEFDVEPKVLFISSCTA